MPACLIDHEITGAKGGKGNRIEHCQFACYFAFFSFVQRLKRRDGRDEQALYRWDELIGGTFYISLYRVLCHFPSDLHDQIVGLEIISQPDTRTICVSQLDMTFIDLPHRGLSIEIKLPDRDDSILVKLKSARHRLLPGKKIQNPTPQGKFAAPRDLGCPLITGILQRENHASG